MKFGSQFSLKTWVNVLLQCPGVSSEVVTCWGSNTTLRFSREGVEHKLSVGLINRRAWVEDSDYNLVEDVSVFDLHHALLGKRWLSDKAREVLEREK